MKTVSNYQIAKLKTVFNYFSWKTIKQQNKFGN